MMGYTPKGEKALIAEMFPEVTPEDLKPQNPCLALYGTGPAGARCKGCAFLGVLQYSKRYYRCIQREVNHSPSTDHHLNWPACGKYIEGKHYTRS